MDQSQLREQLSPRYDLGREIGRGGMATVYFARDVRHGRDVAIKVLHEDLSVALGPERFRRETQIASQLSHPNILPIYDSGEAGRLLYLVMPFIDGASLRSRIQTERQMVVDDAVRIGCEIANALDFAHRHDIIHRDVKPENILLRDGHGILADFGIARAIHAAGEGRLTSTGISVGTPTYMSPEQASAQSDIDGRSDVYSLGCCVYEMLAGSPPFVGPSSSVVIARHLLDQVPSLVIARQAVPEHVEAAVMRSLAKAPADRFRTAEEFAAALSGRTPVTMPRLSQAGMRSAAGPVGRKARAAVLGVLLAGLVAVGGWMLRPTRAAVADISDLDPRRVAVLPFEDRSDGRLGYFADGLTHALAQRLADVHTLDVISTNAVAQLPPDASVDSMARILGAGTLVQGTIEAVRADSARITLRLVEGASGVDFRRASFTGAISDPLQLRDDLAGKASEFLRSRLGEEIRLRTRRGETSSGVAWGLVQQAERLRKDAERLAVEDDAAGAASGFARADSMLSAAEREDSRWPEPVVLRGTIAYRQARLEEDRVRVANWIAIGLGHAERALALESRSADALELRGTLRYLTWLRSLEPDPTRASELLRAAEADLRAAVSIAPSQATAWNVLSHLHYQKPDFLEAKLAAQRAYEEDAYLSAAPDLIWRLYTTSYDLEDFAGASQWCAVGGRRFASNPRFVECRLWLMTARGVDPDIDRAWLLWDTLGRIVPKADWEVQRREASMIVAGVIARAAGADSVARSVLADSARRVLERARPSQEQDPDGESLETEAFIWTLLGSKDEALRVLKRYFTINPGHRALFAQSSSWWWRSLRDDPRFGDLVGHQGQ